MGGVKTKFKKKGILSELFEVVSPLFLEGEKREKKYGKLTMMHTI